MQKFSFAYDFVPPESTNDVRSKQIFKKIKKEYLLTNEISLVGNVGGTLGMFVGFSFIGTSESILAIIQFIWKRLTARRRNSRGKRQLRFKDSKAKN